MKSSTTIPALAFEIIKRYGGRLWVESEKGKGATFHFTVAKKYI